MFNPYVKAIIGAIVVFLGSLATAIDDHNHITHSELIIAIGLAIAALGAIWAAHKTIKWLVGGGLAGLSALAVALQDDKLSLQEGITIASAVAVALGAIYVSTNTASSTPIGPAPPAL